MYENYRTEKLSRGVNSSTGAPYTEEQSIRPEEMATQTVRIKEEQLRREEEKLREAELKIQREIAERRQELLAKEESLRSVSSNVLDCFADISHRNLENRLAAQSLAQENSMSTQHSQLE